ncbi:hypothetical protein RUM44_006583 [Polyplax serrata]|uniref:Uncharacterized protein n=1 Tax=Polyplax serrata TaxID=468196 RepID=A0ABR1AIP8_POLSC
MEANGFKSLSSPTGPINNNEPFGLIELQELNKRSTQFLVLASTVSNYRSVVDRSADIMENDNGPLELLYRTSTTENQERCGNKRDKSALKVSKRTVLLLRNAQEVSSIFGKIKKKRQFSVSLNGSGVTKTDGDRGAGHPGGDDTFTSPARLFFHPQRDRVNSRSVFPPSFAGLLPASALFPRDKKNATSSFMQVDPK